MSLMDEVERKRFLDTMRADADFRAAVQRELLTDELLNLPQAVARLTSTVATLVDIAAQQRADFTVLVAEVRNYMERTITLVGDGFAAARADTNQVRAEITELRTDMTGLRTDMERGFTGVDARFDQVDAEIQEIKDQLAS